MDFTSIMQAAKHNSVKAQQQNDPVLKTKLSAPKKVQRKVDVEAIRKRLDEAKKSKETVKKKLPAKPAPPAAKTSKSAPPGVNKNSTEVSKFKKPEEKRREEKAKYENKEHEEKHKQFMNKIQKMATKPDSKSKSDHSVVKATSKMKPPAEPKKSRPLVNPPSFKDLMKLAEKVATSPSPISSIDKPTNSSLDNGKPIKLKTEQNNSNNKTTKKTDTHGGKHKQSNEKPNRKAEKHKLANEKLAKNATSDRNGSATKNKHSSGGKSNDDSTSKVTVTKRPVSDSRNVRTDVPAKKPALSASAMAKLAHREGRGPAPSPQPKPSGSGGSKSQKIGGSKADMAPKNTNKGNVPQKLSSQEKSSKENKGGKLAAVEAKPAVSAWDRLMGASNTKDKEKAKKKTSSRYAIDSDEEDGDLDDFIDDGDDDIDYSAAIRDIFGYDKSRYRDEDFDDRTMVARYSDIMKEEVRSTKLAQEEDQKELELEEMEKKKKIMKKMNKK